jgi:chromate transport protein ChrA/LmbE family N-acetylglucosaminyl deacetylase
MWFARQLRKLVPARKTKPNSGPKVLLVVAHPDDEYAVAATVYRITRELKGTVDQFIITNGEGGFRYSQAAEAIYGTKLSDEAIGRAQLPAIRRREVIEAGKILGVRKHFFLDQGDSQFNTDAAEPLNGLWDRDLVSARLRELLRAEQYQYVFLLLPTEHTHGHHQATALLTMRRLLECRRSHALWYSVPVPVEERDSPFVFENQEAQYTVDRRLPIGPNAALTYSIVVNWVISAHKSQGLLQTQAGKHDAEQFWVLDNGCANSRAAASTLFAQLDSRRTRRLRRRCGRGRGAVMPPQVSRSALALYFLRLGTLGFGGPIALAGAMQRDLVEERRWVTLEEYQEGLALAQLMPGPLAAQLAIYLGWVRFGVPGATLVALAFTLPSLLIVMALSALYVKYGGISWMRGAFYGIGAAVIGIIARSAVKLVKSTIKRDRLLWLLFTVSALFTAWTESELVWLFLAAGVLTMVLKTRFRPAFAPAVVPLWLPVWLMSGTSGPASFGVLAQISCSF